MKSALVILLCVAVANASSYGGSYGGSYSAVNYGSPSSYYSASASFSASPSNYGSYSTSASFSASPSNYGSYSFSASFSASPSNYGSYSLSFDFSASPSDSASYSDYSVYAAAYAYSQDLPSISLSSTALLSDLIPSSFVVSTVSSSLLQTLSQELGNVEASISDFSAYAEYLEQLFATEPSIECAEKTVEQDIRSHAHTVSEIESALSSPSVISQPTYIASLEDKYPSIVSACDTIFEAETSQPYFAYEQSLITSLEKTHQTLLTDISIIQQASSPVTEEAESVVYYAVKSSPSLSSYLHDVAEIAENYPSFSSAETIVEYYEKCEPSVVSTISEAIISPEVVDNLLVVSFPTLASADEVFLSFEKSSSSAAHFIQHAVMSYSQLRDSSRSYAKKLFKEHSSVYSACEHQEFYQHVHPSIFEQVYTEVENPQELHAPAVIENPQLAYAVNVVESLQDKISSSAFDEISKFIKNQKISASGEQAINAFAKQHVSVSSAFSVINKYKAVNQKVVQQVVQELSSSSEHKVRESLEQHETLANAFKVINAKAQSYPAIEVAQAAVDCAESSHSGIFNAYKHVSQAKASARSYFKHSEVVQKNAHQSFHQSFHQNAHQSAHQSAQSFHQSFHHGGNR